MLFYIFPKCLLPKCLLCQNVYSHNVYCAKMSIPIMSTVATCETVQDAQACLSNIYHINPLPASDNLQTVLIQIRMEAVVTGRNLSCTFYLETL